LAIELSQAVGRECAGTLHEGRETIAFAAAGGRDARVGGEKDAIRLHGLCSRGGEGEVIAGSAEKATALLRCVDGARPALRSACGEGVGHDDAAPGHHAFGIALGVVGAHGDRPRESFVGQLRLVALEVEFPDLG
jgi:hypothetical protein